MVVASGVGGAPAEGATEAAEEVVEESWKEAVAESGGVGGSEAVSPSCSIPSNSE